MDDPHLMRLVESARGLPQIIDDQIRGERTILGQRASQAEINAYDMVYFACQGNEYDKVAANQQIVIDYANAGGRLFTTHYSYVWLFSDAPFSGTASWAANGASPTNDPQTGYINTSFTRGSSLGMPRCASQ